MVWIRSARIAGKLINPLREIRPDHVEYAKMARYVVHLNSWGSVATSSIHLGGIPYA